MSLIRNLQDDEPIRVAQIVGKMNYGGVEAVVMNYYRNIDRSRVQFDFIIDSDSKNPLIEEIEELGGRVFMVSPYRNLPRYLIDVYKIIRKNKYKIVHSHINTLSVFPLLAAFLAGTKVRIVHNHSTAVKGERKTALKMLLKPFAKIFATHYFACSDYAGRWLFGDVCVEKGNITIVNNAINLKDFKFNQSIRNLIRRELGIEDKFVIGHIGRITHQKNHDFLIDIFNQIYKRDNNSVLLLVGDGDLRDKILKKIGLLKLDNAIMYLGVREDTNHLYQAFDAFLLPSLYEGLPVVGLESQVSGVKCFYSSEITDKAKVTDLVEFISLEKSDVYWAERILKSCKELDRSDYIQQVRLAGYDIEIEAIKLLETYINLIRYY